MNISKKIAALLLSTIFLFSSLGLTISSMVCLKSGKGKFSLSIIEDCCTKKKIQTNCCEEEELPLSQSRFILKKGDCCAISNYAIKLTDFQNSQELSPEQPIVLNSLFQSSELLSGAIVGHTSAFQYSDLPPPLYGRQLLSFISILVI